MSTQLLGYNGIMVIVRVELYTNWFHRLLEVLVI